MKRKGKKILRIGTLILIVMFLLLPLMSSPVAAQLSLNLGSVWTNNLPLPTGPTAGGTITTPVSPVGDIAPFNIQFSVGYTYTDSNPSGTGSNHQLSIGVSWQPGGTGPWSGPNIYTQNMIFVAAGQAPVSGTYTTPWLNGYGGIGTNFNVIVTVTCQDIQTGQSFSWTSAPVIFTI